MGFFGFPGETYEDAKSSMQFLENNREHVHSIGFGTFDLTKYSPVMKSAEKFGVTYTKNPEWDLALDYYFTVKEGPGIESAGQVLEEFEQNHYKGWDLKIYIREYLFLYVVHYGANNLPVTEFANENVWHSKVAGDNFKLNIAVELLSTVIAGSYVAPVTLDLVLE